MGAAFHTKVFWAAFMSVQFGFVIFWQKEIDKKAVCKMLVKLAIVIKKIERWQLTEDVTRVLKSGLKAQASTTCWYRFVSKYFPNKTFSFRVRFWIQAICGTYAIRLEQLTVPKLWGNIFLLKQKIQSTRNCILYWVTF